MTVVIPEPENRAVLHCIHVDVLAVGGNLLSRLRIGSYEESLGCGLAPCTNAFLQRLEILNLNKLDLTETCTALVIVNKD